ncbi:MAG: SDR family oxidoreductase [Verrucomicrobiota bacterium]|nr:SDR family oxidoreductase [Verrucomicrobiota bacterium]
MQKSKKKVALVTGASKGLGAALVLFLESENYSVIQHYRTSKPKHSNPYLLIKGQLDSQKEVNQMAARIKKECGRLDLLVNNAGTYPEKRTLELTEEEWFAGLNSTVTAAFFASKGLLPLLRKSAGKIINIGDSSAGRLGARDFALSYHVGKTGVLLLTKSLAVSEAKYGVTVNMISPGFLENSVGLPPAKEMPMKRFGTFADIENVVRFILDPESSYVTGTDILVSGAWNL